LAEATAKENTVVTLKIKEKYFFLSTSVFLTKLPAHRQQWWPKRKQILLAEAKHLLRMGWRTFWVSGRK
jgi:hypothetical protein